jgi:DNA-binding CsgD family transcriptional regulator
MRRQRGAHLLVLGAYRDSEINQNPALGRSVAELSHQRMLTTIPIGPLCGPEIEALAEHVLGGFLSPDVSTLVYTYSEGNPFFAEELLQSWIERRNLIQTILQTSQREETETVTGQDPRLQLALMLAEQAESERSQGNTGRVDDLLKQALTFFEALGMAAYAQRIRNRLQGLAQQSEVSESPPLPSGLTQRQVTIIKLVTQGKSNRQIAQELGLTVKTVSNHLTHIFNRTFCENRAAVTAFAFRQGLA